MFSAESDGDFDAGLWAAVTLRRRQIGVDGSFGRYRRCREGPESIHLVGLSCAENPAKFREADGHQGTRRVFRHQ